MMKVLRCAIACLLLTIAVPASAQAPQARQTATVTVSAPVFASPTENQQPLRVAREGSVLLLLGMNGEWCLIEFEDPQFGRRTGYILAKFVRIDRAGSVAPEAVTLRPPVGASSAFPANSTSQSVATGPLNVGLRPAAVQAPSSDRNGFTILVDLGVGVQKDTALESTGTGLAGANLGIGGFVNPNVAVLFRIAGTNVKHDFGILGDVRQVSGVGGLSLQFWPSDRFNVEVGGGFGFWTIADESDQGVGLILGASAVVVKSGNHGLHVGVQYSPAFIEKSSIHNVGIVLGYQYHR